MASSSLSRTSEMAFSKSVRLSLSGCTQTTDHWAFGAGDEHAVIQNARTARFTTLGQYAAPTSNPLKQRQISLTPLEGMDRMVGGPFVPIRKLAVLNADAVFSLLTFLLDMFP